MCRVRAITLADCVCRVFRALLTDGRMDKRFAVRFRVWSSQCLKKCYLEPDDRHVRNSVENKLASLLVVPLERHLTGSWSGRLVADHF